MGKADTGSVKHDVAFSFRAQDLAVATGFADSILPLESFVFARKQEDLAGTDGQASFRAAFRFDSRLNVVLLREGWGQTPWTRVEEMAIQERCLNDGWDRLLVVNLDGSKPPKWIPEVNLYIDLKTFPFEQAVGAIKRQVQQLGGEVKATSQSDIARAKLRAADFDRETTELFRTPQGIKLADEAVFRVGAHLQAELQKISDEGNRAWTVVGGWEQAASGVVRAQGCSGLFNWDRYANDCNGSQLTVRVVASSFETPEERRAGKRFLHYRNPHPNYERRFTVTRHPALGIAWTYGRRVISSEDVAGEMLSHIIDVLTSAR